MTKTVLLTIGRMPKALDLARSFSRTGWRVVVADPFGWHLTRVSNAVDKAVQVPAPVDNPPAYLASLLDLAEREDAELIVPVSEETMYVAGLRDALPSGISLYAMPQEIVLRLHNKRDFISWAKDLGLAVPETYELGDPSAAAFAKSHDVVIKPIYSCSGRGVDYAKAGQPLPASLGDEKYIVQQKIDGALLSTFAISHRGSLLVNVIYRAAVLSGTVAVCFERLDDVRPVADWIAAFVKKTNYSGFISFDFIVDRSGKAFAIECNPRVTSGVHFVHPGDLASAIADPANTPPVRLRDNRFMQQFYPCLTETQLSFFDWPKFKSNFRYLRSARDVSWDARDPLPFLTLPFTGSQILMRSIRKKQSFGEASTFDISWRDPVSRGA